jgi:hypothetical protein
LPISAICRTTKLPVDPWFAAIRSAVLASRVWIVDVVEHSLRRCTCLDDVVSFFTARVAETFVDPLLHRARMIGVGFNFDGHVRCSLIVVERIAMAVRWGIASNWLTPLSLTAAVMQIASCARTPALYVQRDLIPQRYRMEVALWAVKLFILVASRPPITRRVIAYRIAKLCDASGSD